MNLADSQSSAEARLHILLDWFKANEITLNEDLIKVELSSADPFAIRVVAKKDAEPGQIGVYLFKDHVQNIGGILKSNHLHMEVATISKLSVLSTRTTAIADLLEENELAGGLGLAIALLYEFAIGARSPWCGYLQSLPNQVSLPVFWSDEDKLLLQGTELASHIKDDLKALKEDYDACVVPLLKKHSNIFYPAGDSPTTQDKYSFDAFLHASSLVSSRAFSVDSYHGESMVPLADAFNHATSDETLDIGEHVHMEGSDPVCDLCEIAGECEHDWEMSYDIAENEGYKLVDDDGEPLLSDNDNHKHHGHDCDTCDEEEHDMSIVKEQDLDTDMEEYEDTDEEGEFSEHDDISPDQLEMRLIRNITAGCEVFNTYGNHSNSSLLNKYGFCTPNNPYDVITLEPKLLVQCGVNKQRMTKYWKDIRERVIDLIVSDDVDPEEIAAELEAPLEQSFFRLHKSGLGIDEELWIILSLSQMESKDFLSMCKTPRKFVKEVMRIINYIETCVMDQGSEKVKVEVLLKTVKPTPSGMLFLKNLKKCVKTLKKALEMRAEVFGVSSDKRDELKQELELLPPCNKKWALMLKLGEMQVLEYVFKNVEYLESA